MANTYLSRTLGTPTNNYKWTYSAWIKRGILSANQYLLQSYPNGYGRIYFHSDNTLQFDGNNTSQANDFNLRTNRVFRDTSAWMNIVMKWDVTQSTASERLKLYINGVQEISFSTANYPAQNNTYPLNTAAPTFIGRHSTDTATYFNGSMSHINFIDGTAYDASYFGETDATTGEWKIKTSPSVTYGTNGFFILKDGNSVTDQSGNSNNFTVGGGTLTKTEDSPSNVFATANPLDQKGGITFSEGNLSVASTSASWRSTRGTLGVTQGKWYYEVKVTNVSGASLDMMVGWGDFQIAIPSEFSLSNPALTYTAGSGNKQLNGVNSSYGATYNINDIIGVAFDADNLTVEFFKNGTSQGSISTGWSSGITWAPSVSVYGRYGNTKASFNFGNGYFGTTAVASAGTNASGNGIFEYDVPTGFTALSTKGLNL